MIESVLSQIRGQRIVAFSFVRHPPLQPESVILHLASGLTFELKAKEMEFGRYEAYTLDGKECPEKTGRTRVDAGWTVDEIRVLKRQDWLRPADHGVNTIGRNPASHGWGALGTAPKEATHTVVVTSAVTFVSSSSDRQAMVYLADYPGLVSFTTDAEEMSAVRHAHCGSA